MIFATPAFTPVPSTQGSLGVIMTGASVNSPFAPGTYAASPQSGVMISNAGTKVAQVRIGAGVPVATVFDTPILPGNVLFIPLDAVLVQNGFGVALIGTAADVCYISTGILA